MYLGLSVDFLVEKVPERFLSVVFLVRISLNRFGLSFSPTINSNSLSSDINWYFGGMTSLLRNVEVCCESSGSTSAEVEVCRDHPVSG